MNSFAYYARMRNKLKKLVQSLYINVDKDQ